MGKNVYLHGCLHSIFPAQTACPSGLWHAPRGSFKHHLNVSPYCPICPVHIYITLAPPRQRLYKRPMPSLEVSISLPANKPETGYFCKLPPVRLKHVKNKKNPVGRDTLLSDKILYCPTRQFQVISRLGLYTMALPNALICKDI